MTENISLIFKMIDGYDILVNRIIHIWYGNTIVFFGNCHFFEITNSIVGYVAKQTISNEFEIIFIGLELTRKFLNYFWNISMGINRNFFRTTVRKSLVNDFIFYFYRCNRVATDIRKTIVITVIITTFQ
ncbi:hypothetical protein D3C86_864740 [compost metagenome]